ncbi:MAG: hypothetical protein Q9169_002982 [Polycauliona sp. 2 TL-2023]
MCIIRHFYYPCAHYLGVLSRYCDDFHQLPLAQQEESKRQSPHKCPKGPVNVQILQRSGMKEDIREAVDRATKSLNRSLESLRLDRIRLGQHNLVTLQLPSAGGCPVCHQARETGLMVTGQKFDKLTRLAGIKNNHATAFICGTGAPGHDEQIKRAKDLSGEIATRTELGKHLLKDPFGFTLPMVLLSRSMSPGERGNGEEVTTEPIADLRRSHSTE